MTTLWKHGEIPKAEIANEGGVYFPRSKKPEQLIRRIIEMSTDPGDLVLDSFLGSGTTATVAHKCGAKFQTMSEKTDFYGSNTPKCRESPCSFQKSSCSFHSFVPILSKREKKKSPENRLFTGLFGGELGIRTLGSFWEHSISSLLVSVSTSGRFVSVSGRLV